MGLSEGAGWALTRTAWSLMFLLCCSRLASSGESLPNLALLGPPHAPTALCSLTLDGAAFKVLF